MNGGFYNWAAFKSHQAAEFALKALLYGVGKPARGYALIRLARELGDVPPHVEEALLLLDKFYIPSRYVDAWSEGSPHEYFTRHDAEAAIKAAEAVIKWAEELWISLSGESR